MLLWIVVALVAVALAGYAFWPHKRGVADGEARRSVLREQGRGENYNNPSGPNFNGPF